MMNLRIDYNNTVLAVQGPVDESCREEFRRDLQKLDAAVKKLQNKRESQRDKYSSTIEQGLMNLDTQSFEEIESLSLDYQEKIQALEKQKEEQEKTLETAIPQNKKVHQFAKVPSTSRVKSNK
eukprot:TRINITY_DN7358_c0_g1_i1.p1 TRINITY_DN7358_c0_g1~~TRINITY_DN7358_c0_g1_i1.p1  ORF type:complete len:142 (-),score=37.53 TRINITY_DN7358_c0_g1_i1:145-513(-)